MDNVSKYKKVSIINHLLFALLIYNFIFPIRLSIVPGVEIMLYLLLLSHAFFYPSQMLKINRLSLTGPLFGASVVLACLGSFSILLNDSTDYFAYVVIIKFLFAIVCAYVIALLSFNYYHEAALFRLVKVIVLSALVIAISCTFEFFVPEVRSFLAALINTSGNIEYDSSFRTHGFATGGGASLSVGLAVGSVLALFMATRSIGINRWFWALSCLFIAVSTLFIGRTGTFLLIGFYIFYFSVKAPIKALFILIFLVFCTSLLIGFIPEEKLKIIYSYGLEPIKAYMDSGEVSSGTTSQIFDKFYYLPDLQHFLFGAGFWRFPTHDYYLSDVGYMKILMSFGIFGFMIFYSLQIYLYKHAFKYYTRLFGFKLGFMFVFFVLFVTELKEAFFIQNYGFKMLIILIVFCNTHQSLFYRLKLNKYP